jgi:hypothetical protein
VRQSPAGVLRRVDPRRRPVVAGGARERIGEGPPRPGRSSGRVEHLSHLADLANGLRGVAVLGHQDQGGLDERLCALAGRHLEPFGVVAPKASWGPLLGRYDKEKPRPAAGQGVRSAVCSL